MAEQLQPIDLNTHPDLLPVVEEVEATRHSRLLQRNGQDVVEVRPATKRRQRSLRGKPITANDSLWSIVGIATDEQATDVSANVDKYLADPYTPKGL